LDAYASIWMLPAEDAAPQVRLLSFVAKGTLKRRDFSLYSRASSAHIAHFGWPKGRFNHQPHDVSLRQRLCQLLQSPHVGRKFGPLFDRLCSTSLSRSRACSALRSSSSSCSRRSCIVSSPPYQLAPPGPPCALLRLSRSGVGLSHPYPAPPRPSEAILAAVRW
jgi:hypothetical protein